MTDLEWTERNNEAWEKAAQALEAKGYTRQADNFFPAVFVKDGEPTLYLGRPLGKLEWSPREVPSV